MKNDKLINLVLTLVSLAQAKTWRARARVGFFLDDGSPLRIKRIMPREFKVRLTFTGGFMSLSLQRNTLLFSKNYQESKTTKDGIIISNSKKADLFCYYHGHVIDHDSSKVAVSLCNGLKGSVMMNNSSFELHPSKDNEYVYIEMNDKKEQHYHCGVKSSNKKPRKLRYRVKRNALDSKKYVEVLAVIDYSHLATMNFDKTRAISRGQEILNTASLFFSKINIFLVVTDVIVLRYPGVPPHGSEIKDPEKYLKHWKEYRTVRLKKWPPHDLAVLIVDDKFQSAKGMSFMGVMCKMLSSVAFVADEGDMSTSSALAHEITHAFGVGHDEDYETCNCEAAACLMETYHRGPMNYGWSDCSISVIVGLYDIGIDTCLYDGANSTTGPICGDGIQDSSEQCDCGYLPSHLCNVKCCVQKTCLLQSGASCAQGLCCDVPHCQLKSPSETCRISVGDCDVEEVCDGVSSNCPDNSWIPNGARCANGDFCYKGNCVSKDKTCSMSFGMTVRSSMDECYDHNLEGSKYFNCGLNMSDFKSYIPCHKNDLYCGSLVCHADIDDRRKAYRSMEIFRSVQFNGFKCGSTVYGYYPGIENLGYVPDGAKCGDNMLCLNKHCIDRNDFIFRTNERQMSKADLIQLSTNIDVIVIYAILSVY